LNPEEHSVTLRDWARVHHWNQKAFEKALVTVAVAEHDATERQMACFDIRPEILKRVNELHEMPDYALRLEVNNFWMWLNGKVKDTVKT
jgi:hypothetical protein